MITTIVAIGNSQGIRIPKLLLEESGLPDKVEMKVKKGEIRIVPASKSASSANDTMLLSEKALVDWLKDEEDRAWESLQ